MYFVIDDDMKYFLDKLYLAIGFLFGSLTKIVDDMFDIYDVQNTYIVEIAKILLVTISIMLLQLNNCFIFQMVFMFVFPIIFLPNAYTSNSFWGSMSMMALITTSIYISIYLVNYLDYQLFLMIILYTYVCCVHAISLFFTEIGENIPYIEHIKYYFPKIYSWFFLEEDVEISKKKMFLRLLNIPLCIFMLLYGNNMIIDYFKIEHEEFKKALPVTSLFYIGYYSVSVINQFNMIYIKGIEYKKSNI